MEPMLEDLFRPGALGRDADAPAELIETHISWVIRAGASVFKIKRPVDLGFLDFRSCEQRRAACEAEVALNRRLAPGIYEGVVPIRRGPDGRCELRGEGEVVDWAVRMVRLCDADRADALLARGAFDAAAIELLAARLAAFHADARSDAETARFGAPEAIAQNIDENFAQAAPWLERYITPADARAIEQFQRGFLRDHAGLLRARAANGRVRDGHGDLRLEHLYLDAEAHLTVLDCIEFNDRFRFADVCSDLSFLTMDLAWHGRVDLAERLLAAYARASGDYDLYAVADFYESYRAFVRGKVAGLLAADATVSAGVRARAAGEARRYFRLALAAGRGALVPPSVVAVGGVIASGKSTVSDQVAAALGAPVVDADRTRKHLLGVEATHALPDAAWRGAYDLAMTEKVYAEVLRRAEVVLATGRPVVIDASFRSSAQRLAARALAARHGVPFHCVECNAGVELCRRRLARRADEVGVSDGRLEIFDAFCARYEPVVELPPAEHIVLDTGRPLERSVAELREWLPVWPAGLLA